MLFLTSVLQGFLVALAALSYYWKVLQEGWNMNEVTHITVVKIIQKSLIFQHLFT